jgi:hypothetical protein
MYTRLVEEIGKKKKREEVKRAREGINQPLYPHTERPLCEKSLFH